ncbi:unnamed protein product [Rangifer tarandus platyrhynchus]|uniref:Uncharacterized protein n=2 Tax=Rangifer tarandus platyrhynchus TaxID=3082113 RepID=A0ACB0E5Q2_RANTA|nr:unnamed protein product [Rangifer tarandus platyrhynchus]CAI9695925.1 unnamed protein product [Rangifer tarandus platyrhynchus]
MPSLACAGEAQRGAREERGAGAGGRSGRVGPLLISERGHFCKKNGFQCALKECCVSLFEALPPPQCQKRRPPPAVEPVQRRGGIPAHRGRGPENTGWDVWMVEGCVWLRMAQSLAFVPGKAKSAWGQAVWTACRHRGRLCVKVTAVGASGAGGAALAPASLRPGSSCALEDTPLSALSAAAACYRPAASGLRGEALSPVAMKIDIEHGRGTSQADSN